MLITSSRNWRKILESSIPVLIVRELLSHKVCNLCHISIYVLNFSNFRIGIARNVQTLGFDIITIHEMYKTCLMHTVYYVFFRSCVQFHVLFFFSIKRCFFKKKPCCLACTLKLLCFDFLWLSFVLSIVGYAFQKFKWIWGISMILCMKGSLKFVIFVKKKNY